MSRFRKWYNGSIRDHGVEEWLSSAKCGPAKTKNSDRQNWLAQNCLTKYHYTSVDSPL